MMFVYLSGPWELGADSACVLVANLQLVEVALILPARLMMDFGSTTNSPKILEALAFCPALPRHAPTVEGCGGR